MNASLPGHDWQRGANWQSPPFGSGEARAAKLEARASDDDEPPEGAGEWGECSLGAAAAPSGEVRLTPRGDPGRLAPGRVTRKPDRSIADLQDSDRRSSRRPRADAASSALALSASLPAPALSSSSPHPPGSTPAAPLPLPAAPRLRARRLRGDRTALLLLLLAGAVPTRDPLLWPCSSSAPSPDPATDSGECRLDWCDAFSDALPLPPPLSGVRRRSSPCDTAEKGEAGEGEGIIQGEGGGSDAVEPASEPAACDSV